MGVKQVNRLNIRNYVPRVVIFYLQKLNSVYFKLFARIFVIILICSWITRRTPENPNASKYKRHHPTARLPCSAFFNEDEESLALTNENAIHRVPHIPEWDDRFDMSCEAIKSRGYYPDKPLTKEEADFPIAFARVIHENYYHIETQFRQDFMPQNQFCFLIDSKANEFFKIKIRQLAQCFPNNIVVPDFETDVRRLGHNMTVAYWTCLEALKNRKWKYVLLLQNYDIKIKTNAQLVKIYNIFNGTNDVSAVPILPNTYTPGENMSLPVIQLFKKRPERNFQQRPDGHPFELQLARSYVETSFSRAAIDYMLEEFDPRRLIQILEKEEAFFGMDENFIGTLNSNSFLGIPGSFTHRCLDAHRSVRSVTRFSIVEGFPDPPCKSNLYHFTVCVLGTRDLATLPKRPEIIVNKMFPFYDFGAIECVAEWNFNRTHLYPETATIDEQYYANLLHVRFNQMKNSGESVNSFNCYPEGFL